MSIMFGIGGLPSVSIWDRQELLFAYMQASKMDGTKSNGKELSETLTN